MKTEEEFLEAYRNLCKEYGHYLGGCGCCGSPFVCELKPEEVWDDESTQFQTPELKESPDVSV